MAKRKSELPVTITEQAAKKVLDIASQEKMIGHGLKLYIYPGGCSGVEYGMDFEKKPAETDIVTEQHGLKVFIEKSSLDLIKGSKIDVLEDGHGLSFKIDNPNIKHKCSCIDSGCKC
jgi:iron-sulfur cluster assembly accessory protein